MKKALSIILAIVLTFSLASSVFIVSAEGNTLTFGEGGEYTTLSNAISAASDGDTIKLVSNLSVTATSGTGFDISKSLVIDLGGFTLTSNGKRLFNIPASSNATLTVKNGNIVISASNSDIPIAVRATNDLVLEDLNVTGISTGTYGFVTVLSPSTADPNNVTVKNCSITSSTYMFSDNNTSNAAWNLYIYNSDLAVSANSIILKKDTAKTYDAIIYSGHVKNALLNTAHYPNLKIADGSYMTATENGSKDTATTAFAQEYWVYEESASPVTMKSGASIRLNEQNGIRFYTTVDTAKLEELKAVEGNTVELGTLIAPADLVTGELTHSIGVDNYIDIPYKADTYFEDTTFVGSIVGIKPGNIGRKFIGRGYIKVTNGEEVTYYYATQNDNERSLKSVATSYQGTDDYNLKSQEIKALVDGWVSAADWSAQ